MKDFGKKFVSIYVPLNRKIKEPDSIWVFFEANVYRDILLHLTATPTKMRYFPFSHWIGVSAVSFIDDIWYSALPTGHNGDGYGAFLRHIDP